MSVVAKFCVYNIVKIVQVQYLSILADSDIVGVSNAHVRQESASHTNVPAVDGVLHSVLVSVENPLQTSASDVPTELRSCGSEHAKELVITYGPFHVERYFDGVQFGNTTLVVALFRCIKLNFSVIIL